MQILFALPFLASGCIVLVVGLIYKVFGGLSHFSGSRYVLIAAGILASAIASIGAFIHNQIVALFSDSLFRVYATGVSFGVGILFASLFVIAEGIASIRIPTPAVINTIFVLLTGLAFAVFTFRRPSGFRRNRFSKSQPTISASKPSAPIWPT